MPPAQNAVQPLRGEIWDVDLGVTKGREQAGLRPALVVSSDELNRSVRDLIVVLPISGTIRGFPTHVEIAPPEAGLDKPSAVMGEQIRSISRERFIRRRGVVASDEIIPQAEDILRGILEL